LICGPFPIHFSEARAARAPAFLGAEALVRGSSLLRRIIIQQKGAKTQRNTEASGCTLLAPDPPSYNVAMVLSTIDRVGIEPSILEAFCRRWRIAELSLFGSVLHGELRPDSDIDLLVTFEPDAEWDLIAHIAMQQELSEQIGREVDLISRRAVENGHNPIRRKAILESATLLYVA
jgi:hypothetical protein